MLRAPNRWAAALLQLAITAVPARMMTAGPTVSLPELRSLLASGRARLFDVRSREEAAAGTIPGALNIPGLETMLGPIRNGWRRLGRRQLVADGLSPGHLQRRLAGCALGWAAGQLLVVPYT
ncbi:uncharacterized protein LOC101588933 isoform X3 [Octodon degus]|uniref:Uncharacterized protein LOC101588933 isoform X3 n=1 Tax=Octodon degus TaxID=10160 RepID=A0A6P6D686_OCTDE|nr:uncharacterized protein LOC101588933 isoform X3 [Octodon degus]